MDSGLVSYKNCPHPFPCIFYRTNFDITNGTFCLPNRSLYRGLTVYVITNRTRQFFFIIRDILSKINKKLLKKYG